MQRPARRVALLALVGITVGVLVTSVAVASGASVGLSQTRSVAFDAPTQLDGGPVMASTQPEIIVTEEFRLTPDQPGKIDVQWNFEVPDTVTKGETRVPERATNVRTNGFDSTSDSDGFQSAESVYEWTGDGTGGSITFTVSANVTADARTAESTDGRYQFVDTGSWALVPRRSSPPIWYSYLSQAGEEDPAVVYQNRTGGAGVVGEGIVYLGEYQRYQWDGHGQSFQLVVPQSATLSDPPSAIENSLRTASDRLRVGERDEEVLMVAAPTSVSWQVRGLQRGDSDFYVLANQTVNDTNNVWLHEYVHTRQDGNWTAETRWFIEASAEYYAVLLTFQQDRVDFESFAEHLDRGTRSQFDTVRLTTPETWLDTNADYDKGALVAGALDRRIRGVTDGGATLQSVLRQVNRKDATLSQSTFLGYVGTAGGTGVAETARKFTQTTATPRTWSLLEHRETFGSLPAVFQYTLPATGSEEIRVRGPYREGTLDGAVLLDGETLVLDVEVRNVGNEGGNYNFSVLLDENVVATRSGYLDPDEWRVETIEMSPTGTGSYEVSVGDERMTVQVRDPPTPRVTSMEANRSNPGLGDPVRIVAQVENPTSLSAVGSITIRRDDTIIAVRDVQLAPGEETTVGATTLFVDPGRYELSVENLNVTVTAGNPDQSPTATEREATPSTDATPTPGGSGPGFGAGFAVFAVLAVFFWRAR